jgi:hypothetical protein
MSRQDTVVDQQLQHPTKKECSSDASGRSQATQASNLSRKISQPSIRLHVHRFISQPSIRKT